MFAVHEDKHFQFQILVNVFLIISSNTTKCPVTVGQVVMNSKQITLLGKKKVCLNLFVIKMLKYYFT